MTTCARNGSRVKTTKSANVYRVRGWVTAVTALAVAAAFFLGCYASHSSSGDLEIMLDPEELPQWVLKLIDDLSSQPVATPPAYIARYWYRNQTVYFVPGTHPDQPSTVYDVNGVVLCSPGGGLDGVGDGKCPDFFDERTNEVIIWKDTRDTSEGSLVPDLLFLALATVQVVHITLMN